MAVATNTTPTPVVAMHGRYEAAYAAYNALDNANIALGDSKAERVRSIDFERSMTVANDETNALRTAILFQMPADRQDAVILQYHIRIALDDALNDTSGDLQRGALETATATLLDFMMAELPQHGAEAIGPQFACCARRLERNRRLRSGDVEA